MATGQKVTVTREAAIELFTALGLTSATKWNTKRMAAKLTKIDEMVDDDTALEGRADETLTTVLEAIEAEAEIEVVAGEDEAPAEGEKKPAAKKGGKGKAKAAAPAEEEKKPAARRRVPKGEKPEAPKAPTTPGVREAVTRPYCAGKIIAKHGLDAGVTPEMIAELDEAYGKENPTESTFCSKSAWHAIRGYLEATKEAKAAAKK